MELKAGPAGWVLAQGDTLDACWIRFVPVGEDWQPTTLFHWPLTAELVRRFPLHRIEIAVNADDRLSAALAARYDEPIDEPGTERFVTAFTGYGHVPEPEITLKRPSGRRLPDEWYAQVAVAYTMASARSLKPRKAIAEAAGVSLDVAGRWIYEARKRGLLPATRPGRVFARTMTDQGANIRG